MPFTRIRPFLDPRLSLSPDSATETMRAFLLSYKKASSWRYVRADAAAASPTRQGGRASWHASSIQTKIVAEGERPFSTLAFSSSSSDFIHDASLCVRGCCLPFFSPLLSPLRLCRLSRPFLLPPPPCRYILLNTVSSREGGRESKKRPSAYVTFTR